VQVWVSIVRIRSTFRDLPMHQKVFVVLLSTLLLCAPAHTFALPAGEAPPLTTVSSVDVPRYMGRWFEIAKFENWFQKKCVSDTSAEYSLKQDGKVQVINRCRQENGEISEAIGEARQVGDASSPKLEVRFAPAWLSFIPAVWGDYWIIDLDADYELVAVSEPTREYLWVLARSPQVSTEAYEALLQRLRDKGFDTDKLIKAVPIPDGIR